MSVLSDLAALAERLGARGAIAPPGYSTERIDFEIILEPDGRLVDMNPLGASENKKPKGLRVVVPKVRERANPIIPYFLWDKTAYLLGLTKIETGSGVEIGQGKRTAKEHAAFKTLHETHLAGSNDEGLNAVLAFLRAWTPEDFAARGFDTRLIDGNGAFRLKVDRDEDGRTRFVHQRPAAEEVWAHMPKDEGAEGLCLVTGEVRPIARLHRKLKGISGAQSAGANLVSFNASAFESYNLETGENAPVSEDAMFRYVSALNWLLSRESDRSVEMDWAYRDAAGAKKRSTKAIRRNFTVGDTTVVYWASGEAQREATVDLAERVFGAALAPQARDSDDEADAGLIRDALADIAAGKAKHLPDDLDQTRVHLLGLAPNNARVSVRFYVTGSFGDLARNIERHLKDLRLEPAAFRTPFPQVYHLLYETAAQRKRENIPPRLGGELMEAILTGKHYPRTLLTAVIQRIRADKTVNGPRAAMIKAWLARERRFDPTHDETEEDRLVALDRENDNPAYLLGRLFAAYTYAESSVARRNATLRDKYIAAASATPQRIFPTLRRGYEHNRSNLLKGGSAGAAVRCDKEISEIYNKLDDDFPRTLSLEDQGRFFLGFHHQERFFYTKAESETETETETKEMATTAGEA